MVVSRPQAPADSILYPDRDGKPMADNTAQFRWIVLLKENLECLFANDPTVFVAGDLLWYPVEGHPEIRVAPDVMVAFGRPKGDRGSYRQWQENNIAPQVVFEVLSPGNRLTEMAKKQQFYDEHGVEEYYLYDPDPNDFSGFQRINGKLTVLEDCSDWTSPRLGIRFLLTPDNLDVYYPDGQRFLTTVELTQRMAQQKLRADQEKLRADQETLRADQEELRADQEKLRADQAQQRAERLAAQLRALGMEPE